ncbi:hypothetical protein [uncultured Thiodictyon sp.]|uniref:hypothetical protein n=1 Tax=uncultured Thiodictyon sp. TaxID=1846217 RepID=UPI0025D36429|nr:hypothetical protein [uncultured Thiodictyon sp.]
MAAQEIKNSTIAITNQFGPARDAARERERELEVQYLERLRRDSGALEWLAAVGYQDRETPAVTLGTVYTALLTNRPDPRVREREPLSGERRLSALGVLNMERYLVLTGDPGSGKSAFVNFLALCLAGERLGAAAPNLQDLTEPLPGEDGEDGRKASPQPWDHGAPLPVRVILRDFAASARFPAQGRPGDAGHLCDFIADDLHAKGLDDYAPVLTECLHRGEALCCWMAWTRSPRPGRGGNGWYSASSTLRRVSRMPACSSPADPTPMPIPPGASRALPRRPWRISVPVRSGASWSVGMPPVRS